MYINVLETQYIVFNKPLYMPTVHVAAHKALFVNNHINYFSSVASIVLPNMIFFHGEGPRSRCYGRTAALRFKLFVIYIYIAVYCVLFTF